MEFLTPWLELVGTVIEAGGVAVIALGALIHTIYFLLHWRERSPGQSYTEYRHGLARSILLGLELLLAGDIIRTVVVDASLTSVAVLAIIVVIRTFLSFTLEMEVTGHWPWHQPGRIRHHNRSGSQSR